MEMDEMQLDSAPDREAPCGSFVFSRPNIVSNSEKIINFGVGSDHVFSGVTSDSSYTFAKPATISRFEYAEDSPAQTRSVTKYPLRRTREIYRPPVVVTANELKDTSAFVELKKNSKSQSAKLELANSITCTDVPESLLLKSVAKEYFGQFGELVKVIVRFKKHMITVYYATKDAAITAFYKGGTYQHSSFKIQWTMPEMLIKSKKKESEKTTLSDLLKGSDNEDIQNELEALKGLEYNLHSEPIDAVKNESLKPKIKKTSRITVTEKPIKVEIDTQPTPEIPAATIEELQNAIRQSAKTPQDKYKVLEARDRLLRLKQIKPITLATAKITEGTCPDMCPEKERYMRESQWQVSPFEQLESAEYQLNHSLAVKQYSRSSADQEEPMQHDLRPVKSLEMTMSYLLHEIADMCEKENCNLAEWYHFLWDRTRSIRKDITQQELCCSDSVKLIEQCARFHIVSSERLCAEELSVFDPKINSENLTKCLQTLKYMYHDLREKGISCENESEFRAYIILLNLNNGSFMYELARLSSSIQNSPEVRFALEVYSSIVDNNYSRFFKLVRRTTYTNACILLLYFNQVRVSALSVMVKAYCRTTYSTAYPLYEMMDILAFEDEEEAYNFCTQVGLKVSYDSLHIMLNKEHFSEPKATIDQGRASRLVESKRLIANLSIGECIAGGQLPQKTYETHKPHDSFDAKGFLLLSAWNADDQTKAQNDPYEFKEEDETPSTMHITKIDTKNRNNKSLNNSFAPLTPAMKKPVVVPTNPIQLGRHLSSQKTEKPMQQMGVFEWNSSSTDEKARNVFAGSTVFNSPDTESNVFPKSTSFHHNPEQNSLFGATNKSIFANDSAASQSNSFVKPTLSVCSTRLSGSVSESKTERIANKRRLEHSEGVIKKRNIIDAEELRKKVKENEEQLRKEREKLQKLQQIDSESKLIYENLQKELIAEVCSEIVHEELDKISMFDDLSKNFYDGIIESIIQDDCQELLNQELYIQEMKQEVTKRLQRRMLLKYYEIWRVKVVSRREEKRMEALNTTPVWLQPESVAECARNLYHPEQNVAIKFARAKRLKIPLETTPKPPSFVPIEFIIYIGLKENSRLLNDEIIPHLFWKMVISWPVLENDRKVILHQHKQIVNDYLSSGDHTAEPILITHKPNASETLYTCIRHFEGFIGDKKVIGMDALLLIASANETPKLIAKRISKVVLSREKLMAIPVVVVIFGDDKPDPKNKEITLVLENLMESGYVSEFTILLEKKIDESIALKIIQSATLWLAINKSPVAPLEMDKLKTVFEDCLTEELWLRIQGHLSQNSQLGKLLDDPNFIIDLHNEAVNHVMDMMLDPESLSYTDFSPELKRFLSPHQSLPCSFEYFNNNWKQAEYRAQLENIMTSLVLPAWSAPWPVEDPMQFHEAILRYCRQILSSNMCNEVAKYIVSNLFLLSEPTKDSMTFVDILLRIMHEKIEEIQDDMMVVYNKNHVRHFQTLPWWYKSNILTKYLAQESVTEEKMEVTVNEEISTVEESFDNTTFQEQVTEVVDEFNSSIQRYKYPLYQYCKEVNKNFKTIREMSHQLDTQLEEQKRKSRLLEQKMAEALKDTSFSDALNSPS